MVALFISHASEDKSDFVRPLAEALRKDFKVWYDEYELIVGQGLREQIDQGLKQCDFGVVVLSKAFFEKKWPQAELDGLLALETATRKIILPVWYQVTEENIKEFSPILAGRYAAHGDKGIESVVAQLRFSISASQRTIEVTENNEGRLALLKFSKKLDDKQVESSLFSSGKGTEIVRESVNAILSKIENDITAVDTSHFTSKRATSSCVIVHGPNGYRLALDVSSVHRTTPQFAKFRPLIFRQEGHFGGERTDIEGQSWRPRYIPARGGICWENEIDQLILSGDALAEFLLSTFADLIEEGMNDTGD